MYAASRALNQVHYSLVQSIPLYSKVQIFNDMSVVISSALVARHASCMYISTQVHALCPISIPLSVGILRLSRLGDGHCTQLTTSHKVPLPHKCQKPIFAMNLTLKVTMDSLKCNYWLLPHPLSCKQ